MIKNGEFNNEDNYPDLTPEMIEDLYTDELELESMKEEYTPIWCPVIYKGDTNLYLDLHY